MGYVIDRILYFFASPLTREIIDSLGAEPLEWELGRGAAILAGGSRVSRIFWPTHHHCEICDENCTWQTQHILSRIALRRAMNEWRKAHG